MYPHRPFVPPPVMRHCTPSVAVAAAAALQQVCRQRTTSNTSSNRGVTCSHEKSGSASRAPQTWLDSPPPPRPPHLVPLFFLFPKDILMCSSLYNIYITLSVFSFIVSRAWPVRGPCMRVSRISLLCVIMYNTCTSIGLSTGCAWETFFRRSSPTSSVFFCRCTTARCTRGRLSRPLGRRPRTTCSLQPSWQFGKQNTLIYVHTGSTRYMSYQAGRYIDL